MTFPTNEHVEKMLAGLVERTEGYGVRMGLFLSQSVALANGAAIAACFSALASGRVCNPSTFTPLIWIFAIGLCVSFAGITTSYFVGLRLLRSLAEQHRYAAALLNSELNDEQRLASRVELVSHAQHFQRMGAFWPVFLPTLHGLAALFFVAGIAVSLAVPSILGSLCPP